TSALLSFILLLPQSSCFTLFPYTTLFRSSFSLLISSADLAAFSDRSLLSIVNLIIFSSTGLLAILHLLLYLFGGLIICWFYGWRSEEHTSELQSRFDLVCRLLLEKKNITI